MRTIFSRYIIKSFFLLLDKRTQYSNIPYASKRTCNVARKSLTIPHARPGCYCRLINIEGEDENDEEALTSSTLITTNLSLMLAAVAIIVLAEGFCTVSYAFFL